MRYEETQRHQDPLYSLTKDELKASIVRHLHSSLGTSINKADKNAWWRATCIAINELVFERLTNTQETHYKEDTRAIHYLSMEFLMGRLLENNLHNLFLFETCEEAISELGFDLRDLCEQEPDMALGNGGLGRLAACFLDSLATLNYPAVGYGIHYEHGLFRQEIHDCHQIERPDDWCEYGNPLKICRPESVQEIPLEGYVETVYDEDGSIRKIWHAGKMIKGVPWDIPVVGYGGNTVSILRLWESRSSGYFDWDVFNAGGYVDAQQEETEAETISKVLYPNDETEAGKMLRLVQQYFFCSCSIRDIMRRYKRTHDDFSEFAQQIVIQLNDTHPAVAVPELMRLLVDKERLPWNDAFTLCRQVFCYTNHTLLPEALEKWPEYMFERLLPRHLEIIHEINQYFLDNEVEKKWPHCNEMKRRLSIIEEGDERMVRMAHLCVVSSAKVNGVAEIHSKLVKAELFPEFDALYPDKLCNVTNGITPRRWLLSCNPALAELFTQEVGDDWPVNLDKLKEIAPKAGDADLQKRFMDIKRSNKERLAKVILEETGVTVSPDAIFDIQIKRLHEYKRQHLNLLHIMALYRRLLADPDYEMHPRVFLFGAKAAPSYSLAKNIIYAINRVAERVNNDKRIKDKLKVVFLPNYRVTLAEKMIPAADVSEQISTAGKEASGTGNMKLALNGAVTVGTLDGANIEIAEEVGDDNIFIFGLTVDEVRALKAKGYHPQDYYYANSELKAVIDWLDSDFFTPGHPGELSPIKQSLLDGGDPYLVLADFESYCKAQTALDKAYRDPKRWAKMAIINATSVGKFNSDRSIEDYVNYIWSLEACHVV
ncbi:glycogen/starch/alpha-glucan phosphorylase [Dongshaea marina]|uniref:glycogen/starch/alpha-glucan phosphorylase n=1 Tax=Dongshaea marina TaxID=2047966 RepID=UPI000D3ED120|nr:glycogen/starch/alpha-glucan phosphorylase [Dongshaea marina]